MNTYKLAPLLLIFVEVAQKRSFTQAAKKLGLSKSAISQQIKRLEEATGQQLLVRNTRGVILTAVGESLLARSELLREQLSLALTELDSIKEQPSGSFRVSVPPLFDKNVLAPSLRQLCIEFPLIKPEIIITGRWQDLIEHHLDAAIFGGNLKDCHYRALSIGKVTEIFCASPRYLKQHGEIESIDDLPAHQFIQAPWQYDTLPLFDLKQSRQREITIRPSAVTTGVDAVLQMALHDMGIALYPAFLVEPELLSERLVRVLPDVTGKSWHFYFLHQYSKEKPRHVSRFYQLFCHYFNKFHPGGG
ncbi:Glycine cleavage system transcriptional activator [Vibrio aerogenes CECT 7868]|uniref:Glycine cleavage system transcriptional activator n=1 Tax=Vibrio aerogenes CECT 7868 TaxID=1216006 RepID=A0A1M6F4H9_9VIBR|nr:LysR family transcriptional regulator [Vibrio aerogenes]SHI92585.1 Glycine cleavage system transcriptional activator [Vibrio aerogenes CECT 7868]